MKNNTIQINDEFREVDTKTIDDRTRITLGDLFRGYKRVRLYKNDRGEVLLQPVTEIPASEVWLFQNKEALDSVIEGLEDASKGRISELNPDEL